MTRFFDAANALSLVGLSAALACALLAASGRLGAAVAALIVAGICDLFDGLVARSLDRDDEARRFGARLDSLVDACSFGFAPAILLFACGLRSPAELALLAAFVSAAVWRLAYFDTVGMETRGAQRYYAGLPTTYVALVLPFALLAGFAGPTALRWAAAASALGLALAMVSTVRIPKPGGRAYGLFLLLAIGMVVVYLGWGADLGQRSAW